MKVATSSLLAGPYPAEIAGWDEDAKAEQIAAGSAVLEYIDAALRRGERVIRIEKGDYRFDQVSEGKYPAHIVWEGLKDVTLDFQGSHFWFTEPRTGIKMIDCENVKVENLYMDWDPLPFMQGSITGMDLETGYFDVKLDAGYDEVVATRIREANSRWKMRGFIFDSETRDYKLGQIGFALNFFWDQRNEDGSYRVKFHGFYGVPLSESGMELGDSIAILGRMGRAIRSENLVNCIYEDVTLYSSPFVAFASWGGSATVYRRCKILGRPGTNRLMAGNADGINCANMEQGPLIEDCEIWNIGDDFVNVHASLARVIAQPAPDQIMTNILADRRQIDRQITLEFYTREEMQPLGTRLATLIEYVPEWEIDKASCTADLDHAWHSGTAASLGYGKTVEAHRVTLNEPFEVDGDVVVVCREFSSAGAVIRNNHFRGSAARGIRQQSPHALIENNDISYTAGPGIHLISQPSYWGEGPYVRDAKVLNNRLNHNVWFRDTASAASIVVRVLGYREQMLSKEIVIRDNQIIHSGGSGIAAGGVEGLQLLDNFIDGYGMGQPLNVRGAKPGQNFALVVDSSKDVLLDGNSVQGAGPFAEEERFIYEVEFR
ncbi:right-handed parallel beta-helix repeat-containing protein [Coraliomargarita algicola]|uniref:Right-handed parallel beta-helix repeat-containing protein n=1 Tax=Coraliomargarita algicola TaxID=3092156 RepID=A0ABZ0RT26_9BACT|nr:right-handed parallel beta-helix repeat-containing protein [Coraliomargarita sp. J2-16]WPJ96124.1 right-handed parallel beta-helix repeat-containing protein [Coraliomargarita sp. J2-16]